MNQEPKIVGVVELPRGIRNYEVFSNDVCVKLPEIPKEMELEIAFADEVDMFYAPKQILMAASRIYGYGKIKTGSQGSHLFVWMKNPGEDLARGLRDQFMKTHGWGLQ